MTISDLIDDACRAEELFGLDELERYAARKLELEGRIEGLLGMWANLPGIPDAGRLWLKLLPANRTPGTVSLARLAQLAEQLALCACIARLGPDPALELSEQPVPQLDGEQLDALWGCVNILSSWINPAESVPDEALARALVLARQAAA